jgi:hypothetical protein
MTTYLYPSVLIGGVIILGYNGYHYAKSKLNSYIMNKVTTKLDEMMEKEEVLFKPFQKSESALVLFTHGGKQHKVCVPYSRKKGRTMNRKKVFLLKGSEKIEITHKSGVPYLISAKTMGGDKIVVEKDNKIIQEYSSEDIPRYLDPVTD